jgi:hypothetical protein
MSDLENSSDKKDYTPCYLEKESLESILQGFKAKEKPQTFETILLEADPELIPLAAIEIKAKESVDIKTALKLNPQTKKDYSVSSTEEKPVPTQDKLSFPNAGIENEMDDIYTKIKINNSKIKYLEAQLFMVNKFYEKAYQGLSKEAKKSIRDYLPNIEAPISDTLETPVAVIDAIQDLNCKADEIKFLLKLVRDYAERKGKGKKAV